MKQFCISLILLFCQHGFTHALEVENVRVVQRAETKLVDVDYDLSDVAQPVTIALEVSADGGATWTVPVRHVTGAYGPAISAGTDLSMTWDAGADWTEELSEQVRVRVLADAHAGEMVAIPAGTFEMGDHLDSNSNAPVHTVRLSSYAIGQHEVLSETWALVRTWALNEGYTDLPAGSSRGDGHPISGIAWLDVVKWCNARSEMEGLTPAYYLDEAHEVILKEGDHNPLNSQIKWDADGYRLPTEAEWEKAARGGIAGQRFPWGNTISHTEANFNNEGGEEYATGTTGAHPNFNTGPFPRTNPVEYFPANGYGLHGAADNVWEWCYDRYAADYYATSPSLDPLGPQSGNNRCLRGGSWANHAAVARINYRRHNSRTYAPEWSGVRVVRGTLSAASLVAGLSPSTTVDTRDPSLTVEQSSGTALVSGESVTNYIAVALASPEGRTFTLRNDGGLVLENIAVTVIGDHDTDFSVSGVNTTTLASGETMTVTVTFTPTQTGQRNATLQISSNDPLQGTFSVGLTGQGGFIPVSFAWDGLLQPYDGSPRPVSVSTEPADIEFTLTYAGNAEPPVLPGQYEVTATVTNPYYEGSSTVLLVVDHRGDRLVLAPDEAPAIPSTENIVWEESASGLYEGLLHSDAEEPRLLGSLENVKITSKGSVSARLRIQGSAVALRGSFDETGLWAVDVPKAKTGAIQGQLRLTETEAGRQVVTGTLTWAESAATVYAPRAQAVEAWVGNHSLLLPGNPAWPLDAPVGDGWAVVKVSKTGKVTVKGRLGDGNAFTESALLSAAGEWALFAELYRAGSTRGHIGGRMQFRDIALISDCDGLLDWRKPADDRAAQFPAGFDVQVLAVGSRLTAAAKGQRLLAQLADAEPNASLSLISPGLTVGELGELERVISWLPTNALRHYGPETLAGKANPKSGQITGNFRDPETGTRIAFTGIALQKQGIVGGHFMLGDRSGALRILPGTDFPHPGSDGVVAEIAQVTLPETPATAPSLTPIAFERAAAGTYSGVLALEGVHTGGIENLRVTTSGSFTGQIWINGFRYALTGTFDLNGSATTQIQSTGGLPPLDITLQLQQAAGSSDGYQLTGVLSLSGSDHLVDAQRLPPYSTQDPAPQAGPWTLAMLAPEDVNADAQPGGDSVAALKISVKGLCTGTLLLADGSKVTLAGHVSRNGEWSLHRGLYGNPARGFIAGKVTFRELEAVSEVDGQWRWEKQNGAAPKSALYPTGFAFTRPVIGCRYQAPARNQSAWPQLGEGWYNAWLRFQGPAFAVTSGSFALDRLVTWTGKNQVIHYGPDVLKVKFVPATGLITGSLQDAVTKGRQGFTGILIQKQSLATGFYLTPNRSGRFVIESQAEVD
ncbi:SUMF1/EgtB/PvdO family nonheme iron enzyme [Prosthecobacter sp. SYSU 5D2]|uniref:SUMF1/EgtB/PvdO family nonheme iron enzyme n=1 Tax=Prosthecobacter sp. SYSU 5D2 TaxID=3134134 RepID=UPI0031FF3D45